ncbi:aldehyde dehydrogenase family protein [Pseudonocardia sp. GCM10023141]|uniref:aldehyde dehydrogenase family protein n=1 Tax=Pseudonocardia sp. GCM10023141 TaxID=3252653 RepID=UPI00360B14F7
MTATVPVEVHDDVYVDGRWVPSSSGARIDAIDPATEEVHARVPDGDAADVDRAVAAARRAFPDWSGTPAAERAATLLRFADEFERRTESLSALLTRENGSTVTETGAAAAHASATLRYYAGLTDLLEDEIRPFPRGPFESVVRRLPAGVAGLVTPWNYPLALVMTKLAPALMAGCATVVKPAPETSLHVRPLIEAAEAAGIPAGVINVVTGGGATGAALVEHGGVDKIAFTGSTRTGRAIGARCGELLRSVTLELGGKSAAVLLDDVDLELLARSVVRLSLRNSGQTCYNCTRVLVPASRYAEITDVIVDAVRAARVGEPTDPTTVFGPVVSQRQRERIEGYIELGTRQGARLLTGGGRPAGLDRGWYVEPTVFGDVGPDMRIAREEIFGPVLSVLPYTDVDDAVRIANDSDYGLAGAVLGVDEERAEQVARRIETGNVGVNFYSSNYAAPFAGRKDSGVGVEFGPEGMFSYQVFQSVHRKAR